VTITTNVVSLNPAHGEVYTTLCDKVCWCHPASQWFSLVSSTIKSHRHDITKILLKVALITITKPIHNDDFITCPDGLVTNRSYLSNQFLSRYWTSMQTLLWRPVSVLTYIFKLLLQCHAIMWMTKSTNKGISILWSVTNKVF